MWKEEEYPLSPWRTGDPGYNTEIYDLYDKINIKTDAADVYIKKSENEDIYLKVYAEKNHANVIDNETELTLSFK